MAHPPPQHRTLQPTGPPAPRPRLDESLDAIRQEFELMTQELNAMRGQRDEYESKIASQVNELNIIRQSLYDLETQHGKIRQHYEEEIARARAEGRANAAAAAQAVAQAGSAAAGSGAGGASGSGAGPSGTAGGPTSGPGGSGPAPPPGIGLGGPGAGGPGGSSGPGGVVGPGQGIGGPGAPPPGLGGPPGLAPSGPGAPSGMYPGDPYYTRERDVRERDRERELRERDGLRGDPRDREMRDRDGMRDSRDFRDRDRMGPVNDRDIVMRDPRERERGPSSSMPIGLGGPGPDRLSERERDIRERERERDVREQRERERERDRLIDVRDPKRPKSERIKTDRPDHFSPSMGPGVPTPKLGPAGGPPSIGGPGLPPPSQAGASGGPYPSSSSSSGPGGSMEGNSLGLIPAGSGPAIVHGGGPGGPPPLVAASFPDDIDIHSVSPEHKKEGSDWFALFNSKVKRVLDVNLVHTLMHESVVCCVRFSADGKYLATGCNRTAQIYDAKTGQKTCILVDDTVGKSGDLYIRSVCFSPDGKYLATGAEDKQIRIWDIAKKRIRNVFDGHQQEIYSLDFSLDGRLIVSGSGDKTARIWDMHDGTSKVLTINDPDSLNNDAGVTSVAISPNGQYVAAGSLDTVVRIWDVNTAQLVERLRGHRDSVYSVAFTPDGKGLVSGSLDKTLKYWDVSGLGTGAASVVKGKKEGQNGGAVSGPGGSRRDEKPSQCTMNFSGHKDYVLSVAVSHDGQWVVSGSKDRGVQFWDARNALVQCMLQGHKNSVISIDLSPAGNVLATGSGDWQARIWSYTTI